MSDPSGLAELESRASAARRITPRADRRSAAPPIRECISRLVDAGSFMEIGTLAHSDRPADAQTTPGDGKVGGHARIDGRPVTIVGDDAATKHASTAAVGAAKVHRLYDQAVRAGNPFVYLGQTGGARIPDALGARGHSTLDPMAYLSRRCREVPLVTAVIGSSFGGSSLVSALSDLTVQLRGSCLAITSPAVIAQATGEEPGLEELGGVDVHTTRTGQVDVGCDTYDEVTDVIRRFLRRLPSSAATAPPRSAPSRPVEAEGSLRTAVPDNPRLAYDVRPVIDRLVDDDFLELRAGVGTGLVTGLACIAGHSVGVIASQPTRIAGALTPKACDKAVRLLCTCDAYGLPVVILQDTPGFLVGTAVEHDGLLFKAMLLHEAIALASVPILTVILRKSYGLATACLGGAGMGSDLVLAWPGAQLGFMDPQVAARVLHAKALADLEPDERDREVARRAAELAQSNAVYEAAGLMRVDEVIDPAATRVLIARRLDDLAAAPRRRAPSTLAHWPTAW